jgi:shikimate 5-dehydrogenase
MSSLESIQQCLTNRLDRRSRDVRWLAGLLGQEPSRDAKAPSVWNPALRSVGVDAWYQPFDVAAANLSRFLEAARACDLVKGFNIVAPYKETIIPLLDEVEPQANRIGVVDTVVRTEGGRLIGSNAEGAGILACLLCPRYNEPASFIEESRGLAGMKVLLLGAGCTARALAWPLAQAVGPGHLYLANRTREKAETLARALAPSCLNVTCLDETALETVAPLAGLIINATTKGQAGFWTLPDGMMTCLEPYSALAPANPVSLPRDLAKDSVQFYQQWYRASLPDISANLERSSRLMGMVPESVRFVDCVSAPAESVLLRQAHRSGHRTMNGKGIRICQIADCLFHKLFRDDLERSGRYGPDLYRRLIEQIWAAW